MLDIVFCSIPYSNLDHIYSAPALLRGIVQSQGLTARTKDFGLNLLRLCDRDIAKFTRVQTWFISPGSPQGQDAELIDKFFNEIITYIEDNPARIYSFSVLSVYTHKAIWQILQRVKSKFPKQEILIGGRGAYVNVFQPIASDLSLNQLDSVTPFGDTLKKHRLVDHVIYGDGEDAVVHLLKGKSPSSVNHTSDTLEYPLPDYSDYEFDQYLNQENASMPIAGSKGCVRDCDFCDIAYQFGRFRYRSGSSVAKEMIYVSENYGFRKFQFTDSLVNGGLKPFEEFCRIIADYNQQHPNKAVQWNGQWICRPVTEMPKHLYPIMAASGAHGLTIGAESGSNRVLQAMNKKTTVEALLNELEMFKQHGITCVLLTMTGHWSETHDDFIEHCKMFVKILPYVRCGTVSAVSIGIPMMLLSYTPSYDHAVDNNIVQSKFDREIVWYTPDNPSNTYRERCLRRLAVTKLCWHLKIPTINDLETLLPIKHYIDKNWSEINSFFNEFV